MAAMQTLLQIFTEPGKAMEAVRERSMLLLPLLLLVLGTVALQIWYHQWVDIDWMLDQTMGANPNMDQAQIDAAKGMMNRGTMTGIAAVGSLIGLPAILALSALYYLLAAKVIGSEFGFGKWFAFSTWTAVPTLLLIPAAAAQILLSGNNQLGPEELNPLTLNALIFNLPLSSPWSSLLNALNLTTFWAIAVAVIGYQRWTDKSLATSSFIVLLPQVLIFGGMAVYAALKAAA